MMDVLQELQFVQVANLGIATKKSCAAQKFYLKRL